MMKRLIGALALISLAACDGGPAYHESAEMAPNVAADFSVEQESARSGYMDKVAPAPPPGSAPDENPSSQSFLAYRYNYSFALPVKSVQPTMKAHMQECLQAGPDKCQVLSSTTSSQSESYANAYLRLRGEPDWLKAYMGRLESSVSDAKGELVESGVSAEDLTRSILDTDARLKAQITLRTRLEGLLETRDAKLPDLLALERELARVQGEIESATTTLNVLKKRVSMSTLDINYQTKTAAVSSSAFAPIGRALKSFVRDVSYGIGNVIEFFAAILPWLLFVIIPGLWLLRRFWRARRERKAKS